MSHTNRDMITATLVSTLVCLLYAIGAYLTVGEVPGTYEFLGTLTGMICVWLTRTQNMWCWPFGIVSCVCLGYFFLTIDLYGQVVLQAALFLPLQILGWRNWLVGGPDRSVLIDITRAAAFENVTSAIFYVAFTLVFGHYVSTYTDPLLAYMDGSVVAASVVAQLYLNSKYLDAWTWWAFPVNVVSIVLYWMTGGYMVALLYVAFLIHAIWALRSWGAMYRQQQFEFI